MQLKTYKIKICEVDDESNPWFEEFPIESDDPETFGKNVVEKFNTYVYLINNNQ